MGDSEGLGVEGGLNSDIPRSGGRSELEIGLRSSSMSA